MEAAAGPVVTPGAPTLRPAGGPGAWKGSQPHKEGASGRKRRLADAVGYAPASLQVDVNPNKRPHTQQNPPRPAVPASPPGVTQQQQQQWQSQAPKSGASLSLQQQRRRRLLSQHAPSAEASSLAAHKPSRPVEVDLAQHAGLLQSGTHVTPPGTCHTKLQELAAHGEQVLQQSQQVQSQPVQLSMLSSPRAPDLCAHTVQAQLGDTAVQVSPTTNNPFAVKVFAVADAAPPCPVGTVPASPGFTQALVHLLQKQLVGSDGQPVAAGSCAWASPSCRMGQLSLLSSPPQPQPTTTGGPCLAAVATVAVADSAGDMLQGADAQQQDAGVMPAGATALTEAVEPEEQGEAQGQAEGGTPASVAQGRVECVIDLTESDDEQQPATQQQVAELLQPDVAAAALIPGDALLPTGSRQEVPESTLKTSHAGEANQGYDSVQNAASPSTCRSPCMLPAVGTWGPRAGPSTASGLQSSGLTHLLRAAQLATTYPGYIPSPASSLVTPSSLASSPRTSPFKCSPLKLFDLPADDIELKPRKLSPSDSNDAPNCETAEQSSPADSNHAADAVDTNCQDAAAPNSSFCTNACGAQDSLDVLETPSRVLVPDVSNELQALGVQPCAATTGCGTAAADKAAGSQPTADQQHEGHLQEGDVEVSGMASFVTAAPIAGGSSEPAVSCAPASAAAEQQPLSNASGQVEAGHRSQEPATHSLSVQVTSTPDATGPSADLEKSELVSDEQQAVGSYQQASLQGTHGVKSGAQDLKCDAHKGESEAHEEESGDVCMDSISRLVASFSPAAAFAPRMEAAAGYITAAAAGSGTEPAAEYSTAADCSTEAAVDATADVQHLTVAGCQGDSATQSTRSELTAAGPTAEVAVEPTYAVLAGMVAALAGSGLQATAPALASSPAAGASAGVCSAEHAGTCPAAYDGALYSTPTNSRPSTVFSAPLSLQASPTVHQAAGVGGQHAAEPPQPLRAKPVPRPSHSLALPAAADHTDMQCGQQPGAENISSLPVVNALWEASPAAIPASLAGLLDHGDASLMEWAGMDMGRCSSPVPMDLCEMGMGDATAARPSDLAGDSHGNRCAGGVASRHGDAAHVGAADSNNASSELNARAILGMMTSTLASSAAAAHTTARTALTLELPASMFGATQQQQHSTQNKPGATGLQSESTPPTVAVHCNDGPLIPAPAAAAVDATPTEEATPTGNVVLAVHKPASSGPSSGPGGVPRPPGSILALFEGTPPSAGALSRRRRGALMLAAANSQQQQVPLRVAGSPAAITTPSSRATPAALPGSASQETAPSGISPGTPCDDGCSRKLDSSTMVPRMLSNMPMLASTPPVPARTRHGTPHPHAVLQARTLTPPSPVPPAALPPLSPLKQQPPADGRVGSAAPAGTALPDVSPLNCLPSPTEDHHAPLVPAPGITMPSPHAGSTCAQQLASVAAPAVTMPSPEPAHEAPTGGSQQLASAIASQQAAAMEISTIDQGSNDVLARGVQTSSLNSPMPVSQSPAHTAGALPGEAGQQSPRTSLLSPKPHAGLLSPRSQAGLLSPRSLGRHTARKHQLACRRVLLAGDEQLPDFAADIEPGSTGPVQQPPAATEVTGSFPAAVAGAERSTEGGGPAQRRTRPYRSIIPAPHDSEDEFEGTDDSTESDEELPYTTHTSTQYGASSVMAGTARGPGYSGSARAWAAAGSPAGLHPGRNKANIPPVSKSGSGRLAGMAGAPLGASTGGLSQRLKRFGFTSPLPHAGNSARMKPMVSRSGGTPTRRTVLGGRGSGLLGDEDEGAADESHVLHVPRTTSASKKTLALQGRTAPAAPWAPTCALEQRARETHHNCRLAQAWYDTAARWARMDMSGQEVSLQSLEAYQTSAATSMAAYQDRYGPELANLLHNRLQAEWQQLEAVRKAACSRAMLPNGATSAATTPSPSPAPAQSPEPLAGIALPRQDSGTQPIATEAQMIMKSSSQSASPAAVMGDDLVNEVCGMDWAPGMQPAARVSGKENTPPAASAVVAVSSSPEGDIEDSMIPEAANGAELGAASVKVISISQLLEGTPVAARHSGSISAPGSGCVQHYTPVSILKQASRAEGRPAKCVQFSARLELGQNTGYR